MSNIQVINIIGGEVHQGFKSPAIAIWGMVPLFKHMCNLAAIASFSPLLEVFLVQPLNLLSRYLEPWSLYIMSLYELLSWCQTS